MTRTMLRRSASGAALATIVAVMLALGGGGVLAAHEVAHSGMTGAYSWQDTTAHPAGTCNYYGGGTLGHIYVVSVKVKGPSTVFWPAGTGSSSGTVGFKVKLQHLSAGAWSTVNTGTEAFATATRTASALFSTRHVDWNGPNTGKDRAEAVLTWYSPSMAIIGRAAVVIDHYSNNYDHVNRSYCPVVYTLV
jgi:hypothetical protein